METVNLINHAVLWDKMKDFARRVGRASVRPALLLYYVMKSKETPKKDKLLIFSTLAYLVLPVDILDAKRLPIIGWLDEVVSLSVAFQKMCKHITPKMEAEVDDVLDRWFPEYTSYELVKE